MQVSWFCNSPSFAGSEMWTFTGRARFIWYNFIKARDNWIEFCNLWTYNRGIKFHLKMHSVGKIFSENPRGGVKCFDSQCIVLKFLSYTIRCWLWSVIVWKSKTFPTSWYIWCHFEGNTIHFHQNPWRQKTRISRLLCGQLSIARCCMLDDLSRSQTVTYTTQCLGNDTR